jgi:hypothetical protein
VKGQAIKYTILFSNAIYTSYLIYASISIAFKLYPLQKIFYTNFSKKTKMATVAPQPPSANANAPNAQAPVMNASSYPMASLYVGDLHPDVCLLVNYHGSRD